MPMHDETEDKVGKELKAEARDKIVSYLFLALVGIGTITFCVWALGGFK